MNPLLIALDVFWWFLIVDAVLSWVQKPHQSPRKWLMQISEPLYAPIHAILPPSKLGGLDVAPLALLILIRVVRGHLAGM